MQKIWCKILQCVKYAVSIMVKHERIKVYPTIPGLAAGFIPLLLLHPKIDGSGVPRIVVGIGLPVLVLFSLVFLLLTIPSLIQSVKRIDINLLSLPRICRLEEKTSLETDPPRPGFLPGVRLFLYWRFTFGPFKKKLFIPLPAKGKGVGLMSFSRRGYWTGRPFYFATDPFGFFVFQYPVNILRYVVVPPEPASLDGGFPRGNSAIASAAAPRRKEDADENLERRQYIPGDDPRRLDWKHYARTGGLIIRVGENEIPDRGRIWLQAISSPGNRVKNGYRHLDSSMSFVRGMVQTLTETGQEVFTRFPGEEGWVNTNEGDWLERLSRSEPCRMETLDSPDAGETLFIVSHSEDSGGKALYNHASDNGCRVVFFPPEPVSSRVRRPGWWFFDRSKDIDFIE